MVNRALFAVKDFNLVPVGKSLKKIHHTITGLGTKSNALYSHSQHALPINPIHYTAIYNMPSQ
jgi:hypothetical protein